jgi:hypothetical protein
MFGQYRLAAVIRFLCRGAFWQGPAVCGHPMTSLACEHFWKGMTRE